MSSPIDQSSAVTPSSVRRRQLITLVAIVALVAGTAVAWHLTTRRLPFDGARWAAGDPKLRFRMKSSLAAMHAAGELPTRIVVDKMLGPDDDLTNATSDFRVFRLKEWYGNPWYLRIRFDEQGNVIDFAIHPD